MRCAPDIWLFLYITATISISYWLGTLTCLLTGSFGAGWFVSCLIYVTAAWEWNEAQKMAELLCDDKEL